MHRLGDAPSEGAEMAEMAAEETSDTDSDKQRTPLTMVVPPAVLATGAWPPRSGASRVA